MILKRLTFTMVIAIIVALSNTSALPQESWQRIAPVAHSFTILMPTKAVQASRRVQVSEQESIPIAVYYSLDKGRRYVVAALFKTAPERAPALSSFEKFIAAMEYSFKSDGTGRSLTFERDVSVGQVTGKQYRVRLAEYSGVAQFVRSEHAFYALMVIGADDSDGDVSRFLSSFELGEVNTNSQASGITSDVLSMGPTSGSTDIAKATPSTEPSVPAGPPEPWPRPVGPISGGVLNGKAIYLARPQYPAAARKNHEAGQVEVNIVIDELGNVIKAEALAGPPNLRIASVAAAWESRFTPTRLMGQPVKVTGRIVYNFVGGP